MKNTEIEECAENCKAYKIIDFNYDSSFFCRNVMFGKHEIWIQMHEQFFF